MKRHTTRAAALLAALALCGASALAQQQQREELAPGFNACMEQSGGVTPKMVDCGRAAYEFWDKQLNVEYKKARQACENDACRQKLRDMQRHWIKYKEAMSSILFQGLDSGGGSLNRVDAAIFEAEETKKQTGLLRDLLH